MNPDDWRRRARVLAVHDATTLELAVDLGYGVTFRDTVTLRALESPQTPPDARGSLFWVLDWVEAHSGHGDALWGFTVETARLEGRYQAVLACAGCGRMLNSDAVRAGRCVPSPIRSVVDS